MVYAALVKVLFATAEFAPLARVGGLAAAAAGLVAELRRQGIDVQVALPDYYETPLEKETVRPLLDVPEWAGPAIARTGIAAGVGKITLINAFGIVKSHPYLQPDGSGWPDNDRRFMAYSAALASLTRAVAPDVLHLNDWHTCAALGHLDIAPPTMLTIHTLGYQGRTNPGWLMTLPRHTEAFEQWGDCNPLLGGIRLADVVVAVSPHYAEEIATPEGGFTLDGPLRERGDRLVGILNGIDDEEWNPATDRHLEMTYSAADVSAKALTRAKLLAQFGLVDGGGPLLTMVTRLADQKGVDLMLPVTPFLARLGATLIVLATASNVWPIHCTRPRPRIRNKSPSCAATTRRLPTDCSPAPMCSRCRVASNPVVSPRCSRCVMERCRSSPMSADSTTRSSTSTARRRRARASWCRRRVRWR